MANVSGSGIREVLVFAENEHKTVTVTTANNAVTGKVLRVNPLIIDPGEGREVTVVDFDAVQTVGVAGTDGEAVVNACKPQAETKFMGSRRI